MNDQSASKLETKLSAYYSVEPAENFVQSLQDRLQSNRKVKGSFWQEMVLDFRHDRRTRLAWAGALVFVLAAYITATPAGRSLAQSIARSFLGYFTVTDEKSLHLPATPQPAPTYMIQPALLPFEPQTTPAANPAQCGSTVSELTASPYCMMLNAQAQAGFTIKVFGSTDVPLQFNAIRSKSNIATMWYWDQADSEKYCFLQGIGDQISSCYSFGVVPADAVQQVKVGNRPAELVVGYYLSGQSSANWSPNDPAVDLRWREGDHWYSISVFRFTWPGDSASIKAVLAEMSSRVTQFGEGLIPLSAGSEKMAGGASLTPAERLGFHILTPASLPEGFTFEEFGFGLWGSTIQGTTFVAYSYSDQGREVISLQLAEGPASNQTLDFATRFNDPTLMPPLKLSLDEAIQIGKFGGRYMVKPDGASALVWEQDGVKLMLQPYYFDTTFGGRLTKAELIAIAESMK